MKKYHVVRAYYVLPCCLLLLNLCVELVSYKTRMIDEPLLRTAVIIAMVLGGGSLVAFLVAPLLEKLVQFLHRESQQAGQLGEILFLLLLGVGIFWLYYQVYIVGPESILPAEWKNPVSTR